MKDYQSILIKWMALFDVDEKIRKEILDSLHEEVKKGFDVITKVALEELGVKFKDDTNFPRIKTIIESLLSFSVFGGYMLYLISMAVDPVIKQLYKNEKTVELGNVWMDNYQKDQGKSLMMKIDPIIAHFIEKMKDTRMNQLLLSYPEIIDLSYKKVSEIEKFLNWAGYQGIIIGLLEEKLNNK